MSICVCPDCSKHVDTDFEDMYEDGENDPICISCYDDWYQAQVKYWYPLYKGEVTAGLHNPDKENF